MFVCSFFRPFLEKDIESIVTNENNNIENRRTSSRTCRSRSYSRESCVGCLCEMRSSDKRRKKSIKKKDKIKKKTTSRSFI